jgi:hypothetical protein
MLRTAQIEALIGRKRKQSPGTLAPGTHLLPAKASNGGSRHPVHHRAQIKVMTGSGDPLLLP